MSGRVSDRPSTEPEPRLFAATATGPCLQLPALWGEWHTAAPRAILGHSATCIGLLAPIPLLVSPKGERERGSSQTGLCDGRVPEWAGFSHTRPMEENEKQMGSIAVLPASPQCFLLPSPPPAQAGLGNQKPILFSLSGSSQQQCPQVSEPRGGPRPPGQG